MSEQPRSPFKLEIPNDDVRNRNERKEVVKIASNLEDKEGANPELKIELGPDGEPKLMAFFDIDKTFTHLEPVYIEAIPKLFGEYESNPQKLWKVFEGGFKLGTLLREMYRMHGIYVLKKDGWIKPKVYEEEFMNKHLQELDTPGNPVYDLAYEYMLRFDEAASEATEGLYAEKPESFEETKIEPIYRLAEIYKRLKIPMFGMSANPRRFIRTVCKVLDLSKYFIDCASDMDVPGGKHEKMAYLMKIAEEKGIPIPYAHLAVIGDSISGDVGSGKRFKDKYEKEGGKSGLVKVHGLLVAADEKEVTAAREKIESDPLLKEMVSTMPTQAIQIDKVKGSLAKSFQKEFLHDLK